MPDSAVIKDQEYFFNINAENAKVAASSQLFYDYANKEQYKGFSFIADAKKILEYGCGTGTSIDIFFHSDSSRDKRNYEIVGVDIAAKAIEKAQKNYPAYHFIKISDNQIPDYADNYFDAAFMLHVLHHATDHAEIFREIHTKLKPGGKLFFSDLTSQNLFIRLGRLFFGILAPVVASKFPDDLVVDGKIPDKYPVDVSATLKLLQASGFKIVEVYYGHLFIFLFGWLDRFVPLSKLAVVRWFYKQLMKLEQYLLSYKFFQSHAEVLSVLCVKS